MRHVFAAVVVLLLLPRLATAAVSLSLLPVDASALGNFESHDLQVSTDNDWTTAAMVVQLTTGQVHHDGAGTDPPTSAQRALSTSLEFDTAFGILDDTSTTDVVGPAGELGGGPVKKQSDSDGIDVAWFNTDTADTGANVIGRATFSDDTVGIWRIGVTEALEPIAFFSGMVFNGVMTDLLTGDGNNDGLASGADLIAIQQGFGSVDMILSPPPPGETRPPTGHLSGDANDDGLVTGADLVSLQQNFGRTLATAPVSIPEPAGLAVVGALCLLGRIHRP